MTFPKAALDLLSHAMKLPMNLFADDDVRVLDRLDSMHSTLPDTLPAKRFFRH